MSTNNYIDNLLAGPKPQQQATPTTPSTGNYIDKMLSGGSAPSAPNPGLPPALVQPASTPVPKGNFIDGIVRGANKYAPPQEEQDTGRDESDRFTQDDPDANWLEKAWNFANKPLSESILGWGQYRPGAGGVERFAEKTLSGLSSPLSLLTIAAFLPAGIAEGVAGTTLKEGLTEGAEFLGGNAINGVEAAAKVENYAKAVTAAKKAQVADSSIEEAVSKATNGSISYPEFKNFGQYLRNQGLRESDMLGETFARRGVSQSLAKAGVTPETAVRVAKGAETLVNLGFGIQQVQGAMHAYPRALDQLENGDYDGAAESILTAGADTIFGTLGLAHGFHSVQDIFPSLNEKNNLALSDEIENFKKVFHTPEGDVAKAQFAIGARQRAQMAEIFEVAGLPQYAERWRNIPEGEKFRWDKELVQGLNNLVVNKAHSEALSEKQMMLFAALDSGNKPSLAFGKINALIEGYGLQEWRKAQSDIPNNVKDTRTIQDIANEEARNVLTSGNNLKESVEKADNYGLQIQGLQEQLKNANPQQTTAIQAEIANLRDLQNAEHLAQPELKEEYTRNKIWDQAKQKFDKTQESIDQLQREIFQHPDDAVLAVENQKKMQELREKTAEEYEPLYQEKYDHLYRQMKEAAKDINPYGPGDRNAQDEFNKKVAILGVNPQDLLAIREAFPKFGNPDTVVDKTESTSRVTLNSTVDQKELEYLVNEIENLKKSPSSKYNTDYLYALQTRLGDLAGQNVGKVSQLPDGKKIAYLSYPSFSKVEQAGGSKIVPQGAVYASDNVEKILGTISKSKDVNKDLIKIIQEARNPDGSLTVVKSRQSGAISDRLHTLREELNHAWQVSLGSRFSNHMANNDFTALQKEIPEGVKQHLEGFQKVETSPGVREWKYVKGTEYPKIDSIRVVEAASKLMSVKDLSEIGATPEEARDFLMKYFEAVEKKHGDEALKNLNHITKFAMAVKKKYLYFRPSNADIFGEFQREIDDRESNTGTLEPAMARLQEGSGGASGGPPEPPSGEPPSDWERKFGQTSGFPIEAWMHGPQDKALPDNLQELIEKAKSRNHSDDQINYVQKYIKALAYIAGDKMNPRERLLYKSLRKADDDNWTMGYNHGIINSIVDNHVHHIWGEDKKRGYPVVQHAGSGAFALDVSQARHRSWGTAFEGIIQGRKLAVHDPINIIAHDANNIATAAGHRRIVDLLAGTSKLKVNHEKGEKAPVLKASDGMPLGVFKGAGTEVPGIDGTPGKELVNPNTVRDIKIQPTEIQSLKDSGLLDRYIKDGTITDKTPQAKQGNVGEWIKNSDEKLEELEKQNPLLLPDKGTTLKGNHDSHIAAWGQLKLFSQEQAGKIAAYLGTALERVKEHPISKGYDFLDPRTKPHDFSMGKDMDSILHGLKRGYITPDDMNRLEKYRQRNENWSKGLSSARKDEHGNFLPATSADYARLILQEKKHLDSELTGYLDKAHDKLNTDKDGNPIRTADGSWTAAGLNKTMMHVGQAAESTHYPQLIQDLSDLKYVQNNLISPNAITQEMHKPESMQRLEDINARQPKQYLWSPKGYITIDHPAFKDYKWMANINGKSVLAQSDFAVHPEVYDYLVNRLGLERSKLREDKGIGKITGPILNIGGKLKSTILSGSPFHIIQEVLRAVMLGVNPLVRPNPIENIDHTFNTVRGPKKLIRMGVENSLTVFNNRFMAEDASVGVAASHAAEDSLARKIPVVNQYLRYSDQVHDLLFNRLIPSYKVSAFKNMFDKYAGAHHEWSDDAISYAAAQHVNNAFGGINWRELGRSATTQDIFHLVALAPDWLESEMRFAAGLFKGLGIGPAKYEPEHGRNFSREQVAAMAAGLWMTSRVLNLLYSGNAHYETPFGLATKDKDGREIEFSVRTMPTDILHMASDPMGFLNGRMSPFLRTEEEVRTGRNQYGQKLTPGEKYVDMISNLVPIWGQAELKQVTHLATSADVPGYAQVARGLGATSAVHRTPAEKTAANLAAERSEEGSMNPAKIARHRLLLQLEDDMRSGRIKTDDLEHMVVYGNLPIADAKAVMKNVQETVGEDPETARLYSRVTRLDFAGAEAVWNDANSKEKKVLEKLIVKKASAYLKKSMTEFTPDERAKDPMVKRARQLAPLLEREPANQ